MDKNTMFLSQQTTESVDYLRERISFAKKKANDFQWAKNKLDYFETADVLYSSDLRRMERNEDLLNGKWDMSSFDYIENPFNVQDFSSPAKLEHIDIISLPIREIIGSELKRPFNITAVAINPEAASKRRRERVARLKEYVYQEAMGPLIQEVQQRYAQEMQAAMESGEMDEQQAQQAMAEMQQKMQQEIEAMTPEDIARYMKESFKLPEETMAQKLVNHLTKKLKVQFKFHKGWQNAVVQGKEVYYVGRRNGEPVLDVVPIQRFTFDKSANVDFIQDGDWACHEEVLLVSDFYDKYGEHLKEADRKKIDNYFDVNFQNIGGLLINKPILLDAQFTGSPKTIDKQIRCLHCAWKSLKKIKFITTQLEDGSIEEFIVDETYTFNRDTDLEETVAWIPEVWQGTKVGTNVYINIGPIEGQYRDLNRPHHVKLPYYGVVYGTNNSKAVSLLERGLPWQFAHNVIWFRLQESLATDKGKVLLGLLKQIPAGWKPSEWLQSLAVTKLALIDPSQDISPVGTDPQYWKSIDLSNSQNINMFIELLQYTEQKCLRVIGSNESRIGNNTPYETVTNNQQKLIQSSNITEPEFYIHNLLKEEVMTALLEQAKIAFRDKPELISYVMDDFSVADLQLDPELLNSSEFGVYLTNSTDDQQTVEMLRAQLSRLIEVSSGDLRVVAEVISTKNPADIKRAIDEVSDDNKQQQQMQMQQQQEMQQSMLEFEREKMERESQERQLDREYRLREATIRAMGYLNDSDVNQNQIPDLLETSKFNADIQIKATDQDLKRQTLALREKELVENNESEERDRQVELEKIKSKERIEMNKSRVKDIDRSKKK
jgi:hypothetical protein